MAAAIFVLVLSALFIGAWIGLRIVFAHSPEEDRRVHCPGCFVQEQPRVNMWQHVSQQAPPRVTHTLLPEVREWLEDNEIRYENKSPALVFWHEKHAVLFKLRWL